MLFLAFIEIIDQSQPHYVELLVSVVKGPLSYTSVREIASSQNMILMKMKATHTNCN